MHAFKHTVLDTLDQRGSRRQEIGVSTEECLGPGVSTWPESFAPCH